MKTIMVDMDNVITDGIFNEFLEEFLGEKIDINSSKVYYRQELIKGREDEFKQIYQYGGLGYELQCNRKLSKQTNCHAA